MDSIGSNDEKTVGRKSLWTVSLSYWGGGGKSVSRNTHLWTSWPSPRTFPSSPSQVSHSRGSPSPEPGHLRSGCTTTISRVDSKIAFEKVS